jgi:predicted nucleotidyltransferase
MTNTLLNIVGKIDAETVQVYGAVKEAAEKLNIPFVVVGASARDLVLHYYHGTKIQRASLDIDFGIQVPNWGAFKALKQKLIELGFNETKTQHRILGPKGTLVDIIPFGPIENDDSNIEWPPNGDVIMNVLGFQEASEYAVIVRIQDEPPIDIPVASPQGMALLKIIAWTDRDPGNRKKDAEDLCYLLSTYEEDPAITERMYEDEGLMTAYDWDNSLGGAYLLGKDARKIASEKTREFIKKNFEEKDKGFHLTYLAEEMSKYPERDFKKNSDLIAAFLKGFNNTKL